MANLVILESPTKVHTVGGYLGNGYKVVASKGHVRDLPKSKLGIDVEDNFTPHYINIRGKGELIRELKKEAKKADCVYLATDPDREGEAISWHLAIALDLPPERIKRITFNEITKTAVSEAIKNPREIDADMVNAQQARRLLDRLVGYKLSPFLWKNIKSGLSAGRVQSVATRIIVEREEEIRAFKPQEYWTVEALLENSKGKTFTAHFYSFGDSAKAELHDEGSALAVLSAAQNKPFFVKDVKKTQKSKTPAPPFITSTLQQEASRKLNFQSQRTMRVAQELYEGVNLGSELGGVQGLITYMRTDSLRISKEAESAAREYITREYGEKYCPRNPRVFKTKANAQDAHEAIRPANVFVEPSKIKKLLSSDQYRLYKLIWERFVASQMQSAELEVISAELEAGEALFRAAGTTVKFQGYMALYEESSDDKSENAKESKLPTLTVGEKLELRELIPSQHFTEPPARYTEASLVKFLEEKGIGRPSTYTPIITLIISRGYVKREGKAFVPTSLGEITTKVMKEKFPDIVDYKFTAQMEDKLDEIENGNTTMVAVLSDFYDSFKQELEEAEKSVVGGIEVPDEVTDIICEKCGSRMVVKNGRFGKFAACPNYPQCANTKPLGKNGEPVVKKEPELAPFKCELCGSDMVMRSGKYGSFYACVKYPECKFTKQKLRGIGVECPECGGELAVKFGKNHNAFYSCSNYPKCEFSTWDIPLKMACPKCGSALFRKKGKNTVACKKAGCDYTAEMDPSELAPFENKGDDRSDK